MKDPASSCDFRLRHATPPRQDAATGRGGQKGPRTALGTGQGCEDCEYSIGSGGEPGTTLGTGQAEGQPRRAPDESGLRSGCEDCEHSIGLAGEPGTTLGTGQAEGRILTCRNKAVAPGRLWVVGAEECCANFTRDKELLAPELVQALAEGARLIPLTQGRFAIVDAEDYEELSKHKWHVLKCRRSEYAVRFSCRKHILMHRVLLNAPAGLVVDHRDVNGLNNRKSNLRLCTHQENNCNQRPRLGGTSRFKGVWRDKTKKIYAAGIRKNGKKYYLGYFGDEVEAAVVYDIKAMQLFGEFAYLNFPKLMRRYKMVNPGALPMNRDYTQ